MYKNMPKTPIPFLQPFPMAVNWFQRFPPMLMAIGKTHHSFLTYDTQCTGMQENVLQKIPADWMRVCCKLVAAVCVHECSFIWELAIDVDCDNDRLDSTWHKFSFKRCKLAIKKIILTAITIIQENKVKILVILIILLEKNNNKYCILISLNPTLISPMIMNPLYRVYTLLRHSEPALH